MTLRALAVAASLVALVPLGHADAAPAPSGRIAYSEYRDEDWRLMVMRADGTGATRAYDGFWSMDPDWSPDGRWLAFSGYERGVRYGNAQILVMRSDGTGVRRLTTLPGYKRAPSWSPDGRHIVFSVIVEAARVGGAGPVGPSYAETCELRVVEVATGKERTLHSFGALAYETGRWTTLYGECPLFPSWSPRGDLIAFNQVTAAYTDGAGAVGQEIRLIRPDGTGLRRVGDGVVGFGPKWSPDGSRLVFTAQPRDAAGSAVQVVNVEGNGREVLTPEDYDAHFATFSPDGRHVLFQGVGPGDSRAQIYRIPATGGKPLQLTRGSRHHIHPDWTGGSSSAGRTGTAR